MKRGYILGFSSAVILFVAGIVSLWASYAIFSGPLRLTFAVLGVIGLATGIADLFLFLYLRRRRTQDRPKDVSPEEYLETWRTH